MKCTPIFIVGVAHSGTTILYRMLSKHADIAWFSQYSMRGGEIPNRTKFPPYRFINKMGRKAFKPTWKKDFGLLTRIFPSPSEPHKIWDYLLPVTEDKNSFLYEEDYSEKQALNIKAVCALECYHWNRKFLLVKLPRLSQTVLLLSKIFPNSKYIHIVRDGKAVTLSNEHKFKSVGARAASLERSAIHWREVEHYLEKADKVLGKRIMRIRYEDFCGDVHGHLTDILRFLNLKKDRISMSQIPKELKVTNSQWYVDLSEDRKKLINDLISEDLIERGYERF